MIELVESMLVLALRKIVILLLLLFFQVIPAAVSQELSPEFIAGIQTLNNELNSLKKAALVEKINALESLLLKHQNSEILQDLVAQVLASEYARAGEYKLASTVKLDTQLHKDEIELSDHTAIEAIDYLSNVARNFNVMMINEAHHLPQHRVLTIEMLDNLWSLGYRYLALEALPFEEAHYSSAEVLSEGGYLDEPIFRRMLRHASKKGFKLVSYDWSAPSDLSGSGIELREINSAKQIYEKIFKRDENAKVLIHCGYGHIGEKNMLGSKLRSILGVDILTVSQTDRVEQFDLEHPTYTKAEEFFNMDEPYVLMPKKGGDAWSSAPEAFDVSVFWPRVKYIENRPSWASLGRSSIPVDISLCENSLPCVVELFPSEDFSLTPSDRVLIRDNSEKKYLFANCDEKFINVSTIDRGLKLRGKKIENRSNCAGR